MEDLRQTIEWSRRLATTGWIVEGVRTGRKMALVFIRKLPLLPISFMKLQRYDGALHWKGLARLKKKHHVLWSVLEPITAGQAEDVKRHGYRLMRDTYLPGKTRAIDLTKSEPVILAGMSENFRRIIKKSSKAKAKQIGADDFYLGWQKWAKSLILTRFQFDKLVATYGKKVEFWAMEKDGRLLSAVMLLFTSDACFYYQTWTSEAGRHRGEHVFLVFGTMKRAKRLKKKFYNFEGVFDSRFPMAKWGGFSEFKRRFGGYEVEYPGSFMKWF